MRSVHVSVALLLALPLASCGEESPIPAEVVPVEVLPIQGAAIDGSEDEPEAPPEAPEPAPEATTETEGADGTSPDGADSAALTEDLSQELTGAELLAAKAEVMSKMKPLPKEEPSKELKPDEDGIYSINYRDLSLIDYDVDAMLDYMLFPEEYEGEEVQDLKFPPSIAGLDGKVVSIVGYMIPGEMDQGNVLDFMLVRDLLGCCFGGTPMPDEWVDVVMEEGVEAVYRPYMPTRVTGVLTLGGDQDEAGFALGVYKLKGTKVVVED